MRDITAAARRAIFPKYFSDESFSRGVPCYAPIHKLTKMLFHAENFPTFSYRNLSSFRARFIYTIDPIEAPARKKFSDSANKKNVGAGINAGRLTAVNAASTRTESENVYAHVYDIIRLSAGSFIGWAFD